MPLPLPPVLGGLELLLCPMDPSILLVFIFPEDEEEWEWWPLLLLVPPAPPVLTAAELLDV